MQSIQQILTPLIKSDTPFVEFGDNDDWAVYAGLARYTLLGQILQHRRRLEFELLQLFGIPKKIFEGDTRYCSLPREREAFQPAPAGKEPDEGL